MRGVPPFSFFFLYTVGLEHECFKAFCLLLNLKMSQEEVMSQDMVTFYIITTSLRSFFFLVHG